MFSLEWMESLFQDYGYIIVTLGVLLESIGLPLPGESLMIAAAIYATTTHKLDIFILVPLAALGAIAGDQIGYFLGRWIGFRVLARWGQKLGLTETRLNLGRYLFRRYGGPLVFAARFVTILRTCAALLAGANRMPWHSFLLWNGLGGIAWTSLYGFGAYALGDAAKRVTGPIGIALAIAGAAVIITGFIFIKRNEHRLVDQAQQEMEREQPGRQVIQNTERVRTEAG